MTILRFGRKLRLPSTRAIKYELLMMMLRDEMLSSHTGKPFIASKSYAIAKLRQLAGSASV
ncbi:hypothetical protein CAK95_03540 [Pseudorhodoplanes sinuspersici]|uniref:Uncharacterized protein n=1 Tax=Pseudorhodoplanes sinuspersici TaxID=1235591 RepID=A0A1W6ZLZ2_9HYPH|nr:hypothetical protein CAK95_03540 [Pseudorhodoplanes sinuspersici]